MRMDGPARRSLAIGGLLTAASWIAQTDTVAGNEDTALYRLDLDIVWIRSGRIVDVSPRLSHAVRPPLPVYTPRTPAEWSPWLCE